MPEPNFEQHELSKFSQMAHHWWDETGPCAPLHGINPIRLNFVKSQIDLHKKNIIDIGCGGGIFSESLARESANVTGIDRNAELISVAKLHLHESKLTVHYHVTDIADFAEQHPKRF